MSDLTNAGNRRDRAAFDEQAERDEPELAFLEQTLGLHLEGKARMSFLNYQLP